MPKTTINELLEAIQSLKSLQDTVGKHDKLFGRLIDLIESIDRRLAALQKARKAGR